MNISHADNWIQNRSISLTTGLISQDYKEFDRNGLSSDGILNTEKSDIHQVVLTARWQQQAKKGFWLQGKASHVTGATNYQGYLQFGNQLTPFESITDNAMQHLSANIGFALPISNSKNIQVIPNISIHHQRWERDLEQYQEVFNQQSMMAGVVAQWQVTPKIGLELSTDIGRNIHSQIKVNRFDFKEKLAKKNIWQVGGKASYQLTENLAMIGEANYQVTEYGESNVSNNLHYPSGKAKHTSWLMGVRSSF